MAKRRALQAFIFAAVVMVGYGRPLNMYSMDEDAALFLARVKAMSGPRLKFVAPPECREWPGWGREWPGYKTWCVEPDE